MQNHSETYLYLIPTPLDNDNILKWITKFHIDIIKNIDVFIVEELRTARRFLKAVGYEGNFDNVNFFILNEHSSADEIFECFKPLEEGKNVGLLSEAGMPCVADPGSLIVEMAHKKNINVCPLPGSASIILALAASGFNGQNFVFHGYIPIDKNTRKNFIRDIELNSLKTGQSQIFIETPYRNQSLFNLIIVLAKKNTKLCIAMGIGGKNEFIKTKSVQEWQKSDMQLAKVPAVFILSA